MIHNGIWLRRGCVYVYVIFFDIASCCSNDFAHAINIDNGMLWESTRSNKAFSVNICIRIKFSSSPGDLSNRLFQGGRGWQLGGWGVGLGIILTILTTAITQGFCGYWNMTGMHSYHITPLLLLLLMSKSWQTLKTRTQTRRMKWSVRYVMPNKSPEAVHVKVMRTIKRTISFVLSKLIFGILPWKSV